MDEAYAESTAPWSAQREADPRSLRTDFEGRAPPAGRPAVTPGRSRLSRLGIQASFLAELHPLHRRFLAYRDGLADGQSHSLEQTAEHFGIDLTTARLTERYLRRRWGMHVARTGWRAGQASRR